MSSGSPPSKLFPNPRRVSNASTRARKFLPSGAPRSLHKETGPPASSGASKPSDSPSPTRLPSIRSFDHKVFVMSVRLRGTDARRPSIARCGNPRSFPLLTERSSHILISETDMSKPNDLVQGTLDLLLLKILALEPLHGWAISLRLKSISGDVLQVSEGSLYPALHKLEQEGWITAEWKQTENNRRAKFYSLTPLGRGQLESEAANWQRLSSAISHVIQLSE